MPPSEEVYGYAWKTTNTALNVAAHVIASVSTFGIGALVTGTPDFEHMAIVVYGYTFEFGAFGLTNKLVQGGTPKSMCNVQPGGRRRFLGRTGKTVNEFYAWYEKSKEKYHKNSYNVVTRNCIHWVQEAVKFLGVESDPAWEKLEKWIYLHSVQARVGATLFDSSNSSS